jgi:PAS domain S-box-containing protein
MVDENPTTADRASDEGILALDREYHIMSCNEASRQLLGVDVYPGGRLAPERIWTGECLQKVNATIEMVFESGQVQAPIRTWRYMDGREKIGIIFTAQPLHRRSGKVLGTIITLRKTVRTDESILTEAVLGKHPEDGQVPEGMVGGGLLESLPEGVFTINASWRIVSFNNKAEEITGFKREEVIGRHCWKIFRSELCQVGCPLQVAVETGRTSVDQDVRIINKGGYQQTILVNTGVLRDVDGCITGAVETFRPLVGEGFSKKYKVGQTAFAHIIGQSRAMQRIFAMLPDIAASNANVLITGESGTGKDLIARTIHDQSTRSRNPYVAVNCSALAESLLESELFGHEKAAFTGATEQKAGRFEKAGDGTLFLDEIGELKPQLQIKLLRVLEQHEFERVGGTRTIPMKARIISATNKDLRQAIQQGHFREDFYYRLRTVPLNIPPLRERPADIPLLVEYFIRNFNARYNKRIMSVHPEVMDLFMSHHWPGNVRELERTLEHAYVFVKGPVIQLQYLPSSDEFNIRETLPPAYKTAKGRRPTPERVQWALERVSGNRTKAAELLGVSRTTLWRLMKEQ